MNPGKLLTLPVEQSPSTTRVFAGRVHAGSPSVFSSDIWRVPSFNPADIDNYDFKWDTAIELTQDFKSELTRLQINGWKSKQASLVGEMLWGLKCFVYAKLNPREGQSGGAAVTAYKFYVVGMKILGWLVGNGIFSFQDIDRAVLDDFASTVNALSDRLSSSSINDYFRWWTQFYLERARLPNSCRLSVEPFNGRTRLPNSKRIPHIPDEILIPLLAEASKWVATYFTDIMRCRSKYDSRWTKKHLSRDRRRAPFRFDHFAQAKDDKRQWHEGIRDGKQLWQLENHLQSAAAVLILVATGMRRSELLALESEFQITCQIDDNKEFEVFRIHSKTFKISTSPHGHMRPWVIGSRPVGSTNLPLGVQAFKALQSLAKLRGTNYLFAHSRAFGVSGSPRYKATPFVYCRRRGSSMHRHINQFAQQKRHGTYVFEKRVLDWRFSHHQFRKTFVRLIVRIDPGAIGSLYEALGHAGSSTFSNHYFPEDVELADQIGAERMAILTDTLMEASLSNNPGGKMADRLKHANFQLRAKIINPESLQEFLRKIAEMGNLRVFPSAWGICIYRNKGDSKCHGDNDGPNLARRNPSVCVGCPHLLVPDTPKYIDWHRWRVAEIESEISSYRLSVTSPSYLIHIVDELKAQRDESLVILRQMRASA